MSASRPSWEAPSAAGAAHGPVARVLSVMPGQPEGHNMVFAREAAKALRASGVAVRDYFVASRTSPIALWRDWRRLRAMLRSGEFDLLHAQYGAVNGFLCAAAAGRLPLVLSLRGSDLNRVPSMNRMRGAVTRLLSQLAAWRADAVVCVSADLREQLWCGHGKVRVIPTGVDLDTFRPEDRAQVRAALHWAADEPVVLFNAGKAPVQKGLPVVEEAIARLRARDGRVRLHVTTGGHTRIEMAAFFNAADCLVLASETEGSPNVVKEAMACNLPVVSVAVGDVRERLREAVPGAIVPREAGALASAVEQVLASGRRSNGRVLLQRQGLAQADSVARVRELYATLASARAPGMHGGTA